MTIAIALSVLAGMAIGFQFRIFMVVPAILAAAAATIIISVAQGDAFWSTAGLALLSAVSVQLGYLCGTFALSMKETPVREAAEAALPRNAYRSRSGISA
jgi:hypothetical protein